MKELSVHTTAADAKTDKIHPLQLSLDVQNEMGDDDWLVFDGGNTHFWSEIAINLAGWNGKKLGGYGELVETRDQLAPAIQRAIASGKTACINVKDKGVISPIVLATTNKRDKASIEQLAF